MYTCEKGIQPPMAQGRSAKIISTIEWIRTSRLSIKGRVAACQSWHRSPADRKYTPVRYSSRFKDSFFAETWSGSEEGSYLRLVDSLSWHRNRAGRRYIPAVRLRLETGGGWRGYRGTSLIKNNTPARTGSNVYTCGGTISDTMYLFISFGKSLSPQNRHLNILISNS